MSCQSNNEPKEIAFDQPLAFAAPADFDIEQMNRLAFAAALYACTGFVLSDEWVKARSMRRYVYTEQGNTRQLMHVDEGTLELVKRTAKVFNQQVSELAGNQAGENLHMTFLTPTVLDVQAKLALFAECALLFQMLPGIGDRIHLPVKKRGQHQ